MATLEILILQVNELYRVLLSVMIRGIADESQIPVRVTAPVKNPAHELNLANLMGIVNYSLVILDGEEYGDSIAAAVRAASPDSKIWIATPYSNSPQNVKVPNFDFVFSASGASIDLLSPHVRQAAGMSPKRPPYC